jgi:hypothetical protein
MTTPTEYWRWTFTDEFGNRRDTSYWMNRNNAVKVLKDPVPVEGTRQMRLLPDGPDEHHLTSGFMNAKKPANP